MATYSSLNKKSYYMTGNWYKVTGEITLEDVKKLNTLTTETILVIDNTKNQNSEIIKKITSPNIKFSVMGGLDYLNKNKYNDIDYVERTFIKPFALAKIIEYFESIERKIRYGWTDLEKCMFVYMTLAEKLHYKYKTEKDRENGIDVVRSLHGLLYGRLVCSGFALVFKEAMDRIGIKCIYQNKPGHHSWNILSINGKNYAIDLTWDCDSKKEDNKCRFIYFGRDKDFYSNKHHDISDSKEEIKYNLDVVDYDELNKSYSNILNNGNIKKAQLNKLIDKNGNEIHYKKINENNNDITYIVMYNNNLNVIHTTSKDINVLTKTNIINAVLYNNGFIDNKKELKNKFVSYIRNDNSKFLITYNKRINNINEYYYFDYIKENDIYTLRRGVILSEMDLVNVDYNKKEAIANILLSPDRLKRKINNYNGYVGYLNSNNELYYDMNFERKELNIQNRK